MKPLATASLALLVVVGCAAPVEPPPAPVGGPAVLQPAEAEEAAPDKFDREALKAAARQVYLSWCGHDRLAPGYAQSAAMVTQAGPDIIPVLTELLADPDIPDRLTRRAAGVALKYPFSAPLRAAIRERRDPPALASDNYWAMSDLFDYFVKFGDESDLIWMEKAVERLWDQHRQYGIDKLKLFRSRMQTN